MRNWGNSEEELCHLIYSADATQISKILNDFYNKIFSISNSIIIYHENISNGYLMKHF